MSIEKTIRCLFRAGLLGLMLLCSTAFADGHEHGTFFLTLENAYRQRITAVVTFYSTVAEGWVCFGWKGIDPGASEEIQLRGACPSTIKIYANAPSGAQWGGTDSKDRINISNKSFWYNYNDKRTLQPKPDMVRIARPLDIPEGKTQWRYKLYE